MRLSTPGQAISLRDWELGDLEPFRFANIGHHPWMDLNGPYYPRPTVDELDEQIVAKAKLITANDWTTPRTQQVITNEANEFLGMVSWYWQSQETRWLSIGLVIYDEANWRRGIGYQALRIWCQYLLDQQPELARLDLRTWSGNQGMMRLGGKLGFTLEARFRNARIVNGEYYDGIGMGLLRHEWDQLELIVEP